MAMKLNRRFQFQYSLRALLIAFQVTGPVLGIVANKWHQARRQKAAVEIIESHPDWSVTYDFERDGWSILQERLVPEPGGDAGTGDWKEVAFVQSWARRESE